MKKRSLVSAIAMLIVSAIVLTSATFAWFQAGASKVSVSTINAEVSNTSGAIYIRGDDDTTWGSSVSNDDFKFVISKDAYAPVSINVSNLASSTGDDGLAFSGYTAKTLSYDGSKFTAGADAGAGAGYSIGYFEMYTSAAGGKTVTVTPTVQDTASGSKKPMHCYILGEGGTAINWGAQGYTPVVETVSEIADNLDGGNLGIIDSAEDAGESKVLGEAVTASTTAAPFEITLGEGTTGAKKVYFIVWAEGQDPTCVSGCSSAFSLKFDIEEKAE